MSEEIPGLPATLSDLLSRLEGYLTGHVEPECYELPCNHVPSCDAPLGLALECSNALAALRVLEGTAPEFSELDVRAAWNEGYELRGLEANGEADDAPSFTEWLGQLRGWRQA